MVHVTPHSNLLSALGQRPGPVQPGAPVRARDEGQAEPRPALLQRSGKLSAKALSSQQELERARAAVSETRFLREAPGRTPAQPAFRHPGQIVDIRV